MHRPIHGDDSGQRIGVICNADHDVFGAVAERIEDAGVSVTFFEPGRPIDDEELEDVSLLMNKKVDPVSVRALARAKRESIPTWNGYLTVLLGFRMIGYRALEQAGFKVPPTTTEKPDGDYVAKTLVDWHFRPDPEMNGEGDIYQPLLPSTDLDYKYYGVATGDGIAVTVLKTTSKLHGDKRPLGFTEPDPALAEQLRQLMRATDTQALGVDCIESNGEFWAVDVNPAMSFRHANMEAELAQSVLHCLHQRLTGTP